MDLSARRLEIIAEHKAQEKYDPFWRDEAKEGRPISLRPVAFLRDDEVVVLGECVQKVLKGVCDFHAAERRYLKRAEKEPAVAHALAKARQLVDRGMAGEINGELRVPQQTWNAYAFALQEAGVLVVLADGTNGG